jgi:hypothetical protein
MAARPSNVGKVERIGSAIAGTVLLARAAAHPSLGRLIMALGGGLLLQRGLTGHCALYRVLGVNPPEPEYLDRRRRDRVVEASEDSFPASDPPAWTPVVGSAADR